MKILGQDQGRDVRAGSPVKVTNRVDEYLGGRQLAGERLSVLRGSDSTGKTSSTSVVAIPLRGGKLSEEGEC